VFNVQNPPAFDHKPTVAIATLVPQSSSVRFLMLLLPPWNPHFRVLFRYLLKDIVKLHSICSDEFDLRIHFVLMGKVEFLAVFFLESRCNR